jgi:hypothetical protein
MSSFGSEPSGTLSGNDEWKEEQYIGALDLGAEMFQHYLDTYGEDKDWFFIQCEYVGQVIITYPGTDRPWVTYSFTFDGVFKDLKTGKFWLLENKTAKAIATNHLAMDDQAGSYWAVAKTILVKNKVMKANDQIAGIMYNFARKAPPYKGPRRSDGLATNKPQKIHYIEQINTEQNGWHGKPVSDKFTLKALEEIAEEYEMEVFGDVSKNQPSATLLRYPVVRSRQERNTQIEKIRNEYLVMEQYKLGNLPLIKNPTRDCSWDCSFYDMCILHERGSDWEEYRDALMVKGDPYLPYRKSAGDAGDNG